MTQKLDKNIEDNSSYLLNDYTNNQSYKHQKFLMKKISVQFLKHNLKMQELAREKQGFGKSDMKFYNRKIDAKLRIWQNNFEKENKSIDRQMEVNKILK